MEEQEKADKLFAILKVQKHWKSIMLNPLKPKREDAASNRWHVNANTEIEIDEL